MEDIKLDEIPEQIQKLYENTLQKGETFSDEMKKDIEQQLAKALEDYKKATQKIEDMQKTNK